MSSFVFSGGSFVSLVEEASDRAFVEMAALLGGFCDCGFKTGGRVVSGFVGLDLNILGGMSKTEAVMGGVREVFLKERFVKNV